MIKFLLIVLCMVLLSGCCSTSNSEAYGALKVSENSETSSYVIFGFGVVKVTKPANADVVVVRDGGLGFRCVESSRSGRSLSFGTWGERTTTVMPESNTVTDITNGFVGENIIIKKFSGESK